MRLTSIVVLALTFGSVTSAFAQGADKVDPQSLMQFIDVNALFNQKPPEGKMPELTGVGPWFNSTPLSAKELRGHVILIDFWAYDCPACVQSLPEIKALDAKYRSQGLKVVAVQPLVEGVKTDSAKVERMIKDSAMTYPVVFDTVGKIATAFKNMVYPAQYFIDKKGNIRDMRAQSHEDAIKTLLAEKD